MRFARFHVYGVMILAVITALFVVGVSAQAAAPGRVADAPIVEVPLGVHQFGKLTPAEAIVARVGADGVGWAEPGPGVRLSEGAQGGPSSFEIAPDGTIWLLDQENSRLLGWPAGRPDRPTLTVPLPFAPDDFTLGPTGTFYVSQYGPSMLLYSVAADGHVLWQAPLAATISGTQLRRQPNGVLYTILGEEWTPVTTPTGTPLPVAEQRPLPANHLPLPDGGQLVLSFQSARALTVSRIDRTGQPVRTWRVTSGTDIGPQGNVRPALVGGDPVVTLYVYDPRFGPSETLALRLTASGAQPRLHLKSAIWGDEPVTEFQAGPGRSYHQMETSRTAGVRIARFALSGAASTPTATGGAVVPLPSASQTQPAPAPTAAPTPTVQQPVPESTSGSWWPWVVGIALAVLATVGGVLLIWRRRHRPPPEDTVPDDTLDLTQPSTAGDTEDEVGADHDAATPTR